MKTSSPPADVARVKFPPLARVRASRAVREHGARIAWPAIAHRLVLAQRHAAPRISLQNAMKLKPPSMRVAMLWRWPAATIPLAVYAIRTRVRSYELCFTSSRALPPDRDHR